MYVCMYVCMYVKVYDILYSSKILQLKNMISALFSGTPLLGCGREKRSELNMDL